MIVTTTIMVPRTLEDKKYIRQFPFYRQNPSPTSFKDYALRDHQWDELEDVAGLEV